MSVRSQRVVVLAAALAFAGAPAAHARAGNGTISREAGTTSGFAGDGGPADQAKMNTPRDIAFLADGSYVIADFGNNRIRRVTADGKIATDAGNDEGYCCDGDDARAADLNHPRGVTSMADGGYLIADTFNNRIRRVLADHTIQTVAGSGSRGFFGDAGLATSAQLNHPSDTAVLPNGEGFLIADTENNRIRKVDANGVITTVAGAGAQGFAGDGGPATSALLNGPRDVAVGSDGAILIADTGNDRIRRVAPDGTIATVAGAGAGLSGDGDPAVTAGVRGPFSVAPLPHGGFLFADTGNNRVRRVTPLGAILTAAGTDGGDSGDGGPATEARLNAPGAITGAPGGGFVVADTGNAQIRRVSDIGAVPPAAVGHSAYLEPASGDVTVRPLGQGAYLPLLEEDLVPVASDVDATNGHISVTMAQSGAGEQLAADVSDGPFSIRQGNKVAAPSTHFRIQSLEGCSQNARAAASAAPRAVTAANKKRKKRKRKKKITVRERGGNWGSSSGGVSASAVGTFWTMTLFCDGTKVSVFEGTVRVRDKARKRSVLVQPGQSVFVKSVRGQRGL